MPTPFFGFTLRPGRVRTRLIRSTCARWCVEPGAGSSAGRHSSTSAATRPSMRIARTSASITQDLDPAVQPAAGRHLQPGPADRVAAAQPAAPPDLGHPGRTAHRSDDGQPDAAPAGTAGYGVALENQTPLWYYVLAEAGTADRRAHPRPDRWPPSSVKSSSDFAVGPTVVRAGQSWLDADLPGRAGGHLHDG